MSYLAEKAAYLKGLADGVEIDTATKEGKLLKAMVELLGEIAEDVDDVYEVVGDLQDEVDEIDEALADVEDEVFGGCDCGCEDDEDDWDFDDDEELALECPHCGDKIYLDASLLEDCESTITCPNCKEEIEIEFDDDCDCGCHGEEE